MNKYLTPSEMLKMSLPEIEALLEKYLAIAEASDWDITPAFENDLKGLTTLAKAKGSTRRW
jgi:hypothetical protein